MCNSAAFDDARLVAEKLAVVTRLSPIVASTEESLRVLQVLLSVASDYSLQLQDQLDRLALSGDA